MIDIKIKKENILELNKLPIKYSINKKDKELNIYVHNDFLKEYIIKKYFSKIKKISNGLNIKKINISTLDKNPKISINNRINPSYTFKNLFLSRKTLKDINIIKDILIKKDKRDIFFIIIYGKSGTGKTHLVNALLNFYIKETQKTDYLLINCEDLLKLKINNTNFLLKKTILAIDKFELLSGDLILQERFNILLQKIIYNTQKYIIILATNKKIVDLDINNKIKSYLLSGFSIKLSYPHLKTKINFIKYYLQQFPIDNYLSEEYILNICLKYDTIYEIKDNILKNIINNKKKKSKNVKRNISPEDIIHIVSSYLKIPYQEIKARTQKKEISLARHISIFLCRDLLELSLLKLGEIFNRNHSTILYSIKKVKKMSELDVNFNNLLIRLKEKCKQGG